MKAWIRPIIKARKPEITIVKDEKNHRIIFTSKTRFDVFEGLQHKEDWK